jgi:RHS repeat-associated protein
MNEKATSSCPPRPSITCWEYRTCIYLTAPVLSDGSATYTPGVSERRGSTTTYMHSGLKNAEAQTSTSQAITAERTYDAFGNVASSTGTWKGPFGYAGSHGYQEDGSGYKLLGHRLYDPQVGRFLTRDPIQDGRNWYAYCDNNPVTSYDAEGLAKVYLCCRELFFPGSGIFHTFLLIIDEVTGQAWTVSAGPDENDDVGNMSGIFKMPGSSIVTGYEAGMGSLEGALNGAVLLVDDDKSGERWFSYLNGLAKRIDAQNWDYQPSGQNSNAFIFSILTYSGLIANVKDGRVSSGIDTWLVEAIYPGFMPPYCPGWGQKLPLVRLPYVSPRTGAGYPPPRVS